MNIVMFDVEYQKIKELVEKKTRREELQSHSRE